MLKNSYLSFNAHDVEEGLYSLKIYSLESHTFIYIINYFCIIFLKKYSLHKSLIDLSFSRKFQVS